MMKDLPVNGKWERLTNTFNICSICFYSGNVVGQLPYTPGTPCTKCASGQGWCYKNLCSEYDETRKKTSFSFLGPLLWNKVEGKIL